LLIVLAKFRKVEDAVTVEVRGQQALRSCRIDDVLLTRRGHGESTIAVAQIDGHCATSFDEIGLSVTIDIDHDRLTWLKNGGDVAHDSRRERAIAIAQRGVELAVNIREHIQLAVTVHVGKIDAR
jgi:hypothetical protein